MEETKKKMGRPEVEHKVVAKPVCLPPELWALVDELAGGGRKRSAFIREAIEREVVRRKRQAKKPAK